jgi:hypothetical protein
VSVGEWPVACNIVSSDYLSWPPGLEKFKHVSTSTTTPVASALKNCYVESFLELDQAKAKPREKASFLPVLASGGWRANHAELKLPPRAKQCCLVRRILWPKAGVLVRCRSLGVAGFIRDFWKSGRHRQNTGVSPRIAKTASDTLIAPEGGLG